MKIKTSKTFRINLSKQIKYIAQDKPKAAKEFKNNLFSEIKKIPRFPYSYRNSIFFNDEKIRDLTFKGYVITFRIIAEENLIEVFGFNKYQDKPIKN